MKPTPETLAKLKPWPMQVLLAAGPEGGGIDADDFEAALQIVEAFKTVTALVGERRQWSMEHIGLDNLERHMSDAESKRWSLWFAWSERLPTSLPWRLVEWIEDRERIASVEVLRRACRLWFKTKTDLAHASQDVDKPMLGVLKIRVPPHAQNEPIDANPVNLPVQPIWPRDVPTPQLGRSSPTVAQTRASTAPSNRHAVPSAIAPTARLRR